MTRGGSSGPGGRGAGVALERAARLDHRGVFGLTSPHGTLRLADDELSWQPDDWGAPVWRVPTRDVVGGAGGVLAGFELWLETELTGTVALAFDPPGGRWAVGGGNAPDVRGQLALDELVAALRAGGAVIAGEPRSISSRPGAGGPVVWPF